MIQRMIGNLMDNAGKWAVKRIRCSVRRADDGWHLVFEDDGPGCSEQDLHLVSDRGTRLDESVHGHGLGLSIVEDIVRLYGGNMRYGRSEGLGGFQAEVILPLQPAAH